MFHVEHSYKVFLYRTVLSLQILGLLLTFSKSSILGFIIGVIVAIVAFNKLFHVEQSSDNQKNVPRGTLSEGGNGVKCSTWNIFWEHIKKYTQVFHVEHLVVVSGLVVVALVLSLFNLKYLIVQPFMERVFYLQALSEVMKSSFFEGLGIGQFVFRMQDFYAVRLEVWQLQPIHSVYLLVLGESGVIGLSLLLGFLIYVYVRNSRNVPRGTFQYDKDGQCYTWNNFALSKKKMFHVEHFENIKQSCVFPQAGMTQLKALLIRSLLVTIFIIMLFDHYFWDIHQGQFLLWIVLALAVSRKSIDK